MKAPTAFYLAPSNQHGADQASTGLLNDDSYAADLISGLIEMRPEVRFHNTLTKIDDAIAEYDFDEALIALDSLLGSLASDSKT